MMWIDKDAGFGSHECCGVSPFSMGAGYLQYTQAAVLDITDELKDEYIEHSIKTLSTSIVLNSFLIRI